MANYDSGATWDDPNLRYDEPPAPIKNMNQNKISAALTAQQLADILAAITTMEGLLPFLQGLSKADRAKLVRIKNARLPFIQKANQYAQQHPGVLPGDFSLPEFTKDVNLMVAVATIITRLSSPWEKLNDTDQLLKAEADAQARDVYDYFKRANRNGEYDAIVAELAEFFKKSPPPNAPPTPPGP